MKSPSPHPNVYILRLLMATSVRDCILHARTTSNKTATGEGKRGEEGKQSLGLRLALHSLTRFSYPAYNDNDTLHCTVH